MANGAIVRNRYNLIETFAKRIYIEVSSPIHYWISLLEDMPLEEMIWVARWFKCQAVITECKEYLAVPLIGITGCIGYYLACVLRQYGPL